MAYLELSDMSEGKKVISSLEKELSMLAIQTDRLSKKKVLQEKQLDVVKKQNTQEEQGDVRLMYCTCMRKLGKIDTNY